MYSRVGACFLAPADSCRICRYMTALMGRVLVLSIPDLHAAQLLSLAHSAIEILVRSHFLAKHLAEGTRLDSASEERREWKTRGFWRVLDGNNDNVIEYLTTVVGALILYLLPAGDVHRPLLHLD